MNPGHFDQAPAAGMLSRLLLFREMGYFAKCVHEWNLGLHSGSTIY